MNLKIDFARNAVVTREMVRVDFLHLQGLLFIRAPTCCKTVFRCSFGPIDAVVLKVSTIEDLYRNPLDKSEISSALSKRRAKIALQQVDASMNGNSPFYSRWIAYSNFYNSLMQEIGNGFCLKRSCSRHIGNHMWM